MIHLIGQFIPTWITNGDYRRVYMERRDIVRASHVCREWRQILSPMIWMSLDSIYDTASVENNKLPLNNLRDLISNTRYLNLYSRGIAAPSIVTTRLVELDIWADELNRYKDVISGNPQIASLKVFTFQSEEDQCQAISPLTTVKNLVFKNGLGGGNGFHQFLVSNRDTLEELSFECRYNQNELTELGAEPFGNMRVFKFQGDLESNHGFFSLLHGCPNPQEARGGDQQALTPSVEGPRGPLSVVLRVKWLDERDIARILSLDCRSLKEVSVTVGHFSSTMKGAILVHAESLEHLEVVFRKNSEMDFVNVIEVLRKCGELKSLIINSTTPYNAECSSEMLKESLATSLLATISLRGLVVVLPGEAPRVLNKAEEELQANLDHAWVPVGGQEYNPHSISTAIQRLAKMIQDVPTMRTMDIDGQQFKPLRL
ncbi:hypothetical protein BG004_000418 [Podila humilis]|nr:hypothetical protein BG004_000418 [Podila humilis]